MIKIGFVDLYLDNWHSNHYPEYIRTAAKRVGVDCDLTHAYAKMNSPREWGLTTESWCQMYRCIPCNTYEELIELVDVIMVMCADDCMPHEELASLALMSGKPVYCDKTFAPDTRSAKRMFQLAEEYRTPLFSCSAQRFCEEILNYQKLTKGKTHYCATTGPGDMINYSVHQYEMIQAIMKEAPRRCQAFLTGSVRHIIYEYEDGRGAHFTQGRYLPFKLFTENEENRIGEIAVGSYYDNFFNALLLFFQTGNAPVTKNDTLAIMAMQEAGRAAITNQGIWIDIDIEISIGRAVI